jgi:hypothetical protein
MRKLAMSTAVIGAGILATGLAANAQYFNYTVTAVTGSVAPTATTYGVNITPGAPGLGYNIGDIVVANVIPTASGNAVPTPNPTPISTNWSLSLNLVGASDSLGTVAGGGGSETFSGKITGSEGPGGSALTDTLTGPGSFVYTLNNGYTATVTAAVPGDGFSSPGKPGTTGQIDFSVVVNAPVITTSTPEPGALAMFFGVSVPGVLLGARRRRNK